MWFFQKSIVQFLKLFFKKSFYVLNNWSYYFFTDCISILQYLSNLFYIYHSISSSPLLYLLADGGRISGRYLPKQDKILLFNDKNIGIRGDYNGVLLLDTILQTPVKQSDDTVRIELLYSEAVLFLQCIQSLEENGLENTADVSNELMKKIMEAQLHAKKGIKAQKVSLKSLTTKVLYSSLPPFSGT